MKKNVAQNHEPVDVHCKLPEPLKQWASVQNPPINLTQLLTMGQVDSSYKVQKVSHKCTNTFSLLILMGDQKS
ncbi:MAG: hypothetical protein QXZ12_05240 [Thermoplasmata archaeon]